MKVQYGGSYAGGFWIGLHDSGLEPNLEMSPGIWEAIRQWEQGILVGQDRGLGCYFYACTTESADMMKVSVDTMKELWTRFGVPAADLSLFDTTENGVGAHD